MRFRQYIFYVKRRLYEYKIVLNMQMNRRTLLEAKTQCIRLNTGFMAFLFLLVQRARKAFKETCSITVDSKSLYSYCCVRY